VIIKSRYFNWETNWESVTVLEKCIRPLGPAPDQLTGDEVGSRGGSAPGPLPREWDWDYGGRCTGVTLFTSTGDALVIRHRERSWRYIVARRLQASWRLSLGRCPDTVSRAKLLE
jgi:hypothetical protein